MSEHGTEEADFLVLLLQQLRQFGELTFRPTDVAFHSLVRALLDVRCQLSGSAMELTADTHLHPQCSALVFREGTLFSARFTMIFTNGFDFAIFLWRILGYWHRRANEKLDNCSFQGNQEPLVGKD